MHVCLDELIGVDAFKIGSREIVEVSCARRGTWVPVIALKYDMFGLGREFVPFLFRILGQPKPLVLGKSWASVVRSTGIVHFPCHVSFVLFPVGRLVPIGQVGIDVM
jgi:hypothetical protein